MSALVQAVQRLVRSFGNRGIVETFCHILHRLRIISVLHTFNLVFQELENCTSDSLDGRECAYQRKGMELIFREIKEDELENLEYADGMYSYEIMRKHFRRGMRFFAAFYQGVVISVNGVNTRYAHLDYIGMSLVHLPEKVAYMNCALTVESFRNLEVGAVLRRYILDQIYNEGYRMVIAAIYPDNQGALRWNLRNGFKLWGKILFIKWRGQNFWWRRLTKKGRRYPHLLDKTVKGRPIREVAMEAVQ